MFLLPFSPPSPSIPPFLRHLLRTSFYRPMPFFCLRVRRMHFIQFFFLLSDGSGDSGPPVSPPRARKGEYPSLPRYEAHNITAGPPLGSIFAKSRCPTTGLFPRVLFASRYGQHIFTSALTFLFFCFFFFSIVALVSGPLPLYSPAGCILALRSPGNRR